MRDNFNPPASWYEPSDEDIADLIKPLEFCDNCCRPKPPCGFLIPCNCPSDDE